MTTRMLACLGILAALAISGSAEAQLIAAGDGELLTGPRILGEPAFAFELDALTQDEVSRPGWPVTTTRASTRMCWTGSAWQTVDANVPCIGRYGLASFGAGTNYLSNSTDFSGYTGSTEGELADFGGYWGATTAVSQAYRRIGTSLSITAGETVITTCEVRGSGGTIRIESLAGSFSSNHTLTSEWRRVSSVAYTAPGSTIVRPYLYVSAGSTINVRQCQIEKATVPGPRHDCETAPCSWAADVHTVSTAGWPTSAGRIDLQYTAHTPTITTDAYLLYGGVGGVRMRRNAAGSLAVFRSGVAQSGGMVDWSETRTISLRWNGAVAAVYIDDAHYMDIAGSVVTGAWDAVAYLGNSSSGSLPANGHIRLVRISE